MASPSEDKALLPREEGEMEEEEEEIELAEEEAALLEEVLLDVALVEAALASNSSASQAIDIEFKFEIDGGDGSSDASVTLSSSAVAESVPSKDDKPTSDALGFASNAQPLMSRWQPGPFKLPVEDAVARFGHSDFPVAAGDPPVALLPVAAVCVVLLLLSSWGQLRRSRRRVLERQDDDWRRDVDLLESAYHDQTAPSA